MKDRKYRILVISRAFYPTISPRAFRATELVKELCRNGHEVTLLTVVDSFLQEELANKYHFKLKNLGSVFLRPIKIGRSGIIRLATRFLFRIMQLVFQYPSIEFMWMVQKKLKTESGYDIMISIAAPHSIHWGVALSRTKMHPIAATWIADCGDPFMGQENDSFRPLFYFKYLEKFFCKKADYISIPVEEARSAYYEDFSGKIVIIPQGFRFGDIKGGQRRLARGIPTFAYAGSFIPGKRDPRPILKYILSIDLDFRFHIYSRQNDLLKKLVGATEDRVVFHEVIPRDELLNQLTRVDFLMNIENSGEKQRPSKLIDYAISGRPIMSLNSSAIDRDMIKAFLIGDYSREYKVGDIDRYRIENVAMMFIHYHENKEGGAS